MSRVVVQREVRPGCALRAVGGAELGVDFFLRVRVGESPFQCLFLLDHLCSKQGRLDLLGEASLGAACWHFDPLKLRVVWPRQGQLTPLHLG